MHTDGIWWRKQKFKTNKKKKILSTNFTTSTDFMSNVGSLMHTGGQIYRMIIHSTVCVAVHVRVHVSVL